MTILIVVIGLAAAAALVALGGGCYEMLVVDSAWPRRPELIQPPRGGLSRRRFWIGAHVAFEVLLLAALLLAWPLPGLRAPLLVGLVSHATMRLWSAFDFIPKALAFERAASVDEAAARRWIARSRWRLPLDLLTCAAMLAAFAAAARAG